MANSVTWCHTWEIVIDDTAVDREEHLCDDCLADRKEGCHKGDDCGEEASPARPVGCDRGKDSQERKDTSHDAYRLQPIVRSFDKIEVILNVLRNGDDVAHKEVLLDDCHWIEPKGGT